MTATTPVLVLLDEPRPGVAVTELEPASSPITGKPLRRLGFEAKVREHDHERLREQIAAARSGDAPITDSGGGRWKVLTDSYSFSDAGRSTLYEHRVELELLENLDLRTVAFDGIELRPERFAFECTSGVVVLEVLVDADPQLHERIEDALIASRQRDRVDDSAHYFPVQWRGVVDEPVSMRFGRCLWQPRDDGSVRHLLVFVSEAGDADQEPFIGFNQPETDRLLDAAVIGAARLDALIGELRAAGILDLGAVNRIEQAARRDDARAGREFERARNVEDFFRIR